METAELSRRAAERIREQWQDPEYRTEAQIREASRKCELNAHLSLLDRLQAISALNDTTRYYG